MYTLLKQQVGHISQYHDTDEIIALIEKNLDIHSNEFKVDLENDALSTRENHQSGSTWKDYILFGIVNGGSDSSPGSPGVSSTRQYKQCIASILIKLHNLLNNYYSSSEHDIINGFSMCSDFSLDFLLFLLNNPSCLLPVILYLTRKYSVLIYKKYNSGVLQYRVPSHRFCESANFNHINQKPGIITLRDFIKMKTHVITRTQPKVEWSNYIKYSIPSNYSLQKICDSLGLVSVNRLNLMFDTVHHSYAGAGLKCILKGIYQYSSILVQITTAAYSLRHMRKVYTVFNILLLGGIGVVVWHKCLNHGEQFPLIIPEAYAYFNNPTSVVEGYKRVSFWLTKDPSVILNELDLNEHPFKDIMELNKSEGDSMKDLMELQLNKSEGNSMMEEDQVSYQRLAILIAFLITEWILK